MCLSTLLHSLLHSRISIDALVTALRSAIQQSTVRLPSIYHLGFPPPCSPFSLLPHCLHHPTKPPRPFGRQHPRTHQNISSTTMTATCVISPCPQPVFTHATLEPKTLLSTEFGLWPALCRSIGSLRLFSRWQLQRLASFATYPNTMRSSSLRNPKCHCLVLPTLTSVPPSFEPARV